MAAKTVLGCCLGDSSSGNLTVSSRLSPFHKTGKQREARLTMAPSNIARAATALLTVLCFLDCWEVQEVLITFELGWGLSHHHIPLLQPSHPASPAPAHRLQRQPRSRLGSSSSQRQDGKPILRRGAEARKSIA